MVAAATIKCGFLLKYEDFSDSSPVLSPSMMYPSDDEDDVPPKRFFKRFPSDATARCPCTFPERLSKQVKRRKSLA